MAFSATFLGHRKKYSCNFALVSLPRKLLSKNKTHLFGRLTKGESHIGPKAALIVLTINVIFIGC